MPNTFASPLDLATIPDNQSVEGRLRTLEAWVARNTSFDVQFGAVQEAADDLGYYQVGNFISGTGTPEGGDLTGVAIMYPGFTYIDGVTYNLIGMNNGNLQFGLSALDGTALFAAGAGVINAQGIIMTGLYYPVQFSAVNAGNTRTGSLGMTLLPDGTVPNLQILYQSAAGDNLVLNGSSPVDLTSWTDSASAWSALQGDGYTGVACFRHDPTVLTLPALLTQTVTGLTEGVQYNLSFASRRDFGYLTPRLFIVWKTSGHATIRTDTIMGNTGGAWSVNSQNIVSPATTAEATLELDNGGGDPFQDFRYDVITMGISGIVLTETFTDTGFQFDGGPLVVSEQTSDPAAPATGYSQFYPKSTGWFTQRDTGGALRVDGGLNIFTSTTSLTANSGTQTYFSITIPGGLLGTNGMLYLELVGDFLNNTSNSSSTWKLNYGSGTAVTIISDSIGQNAGYYEQVFHIWLKADGATNAQKAYGDYKRVLSGSATHANYAFGENDAVAFTADDMADQTLVVQWTTTNTNANKATNLRIARLFVYPSAF